LRRWRNAAARQAACGAEKEDLRRVAESVSCGSYAAAALARAARGIGASRRGAARRWQSEESASSAACMKYSPMRSL